MLSERKAAHWSTALNIRRTGLVRRGKGPVSEEGEGTAADEQGAVEVDSSTEPINPGELQRAGVEWGFEQVGRPGQGGDVAASTWGLVSRWMGGGVGRKRCWCDPKKTCRAAKAHLSDDAQAGVGQGDGMGDAWAGVGVGGEAGKSWGVRRPGGGRPGSPCDRSSGNSHWK